LLSSQVALKEATMPEEKIKKLKKYVTGRMECLKDKLPDPVQGEPALYDEGHINGELWAFKQMVNEIDKVLRQLQHERDVDEVACEISYEMEPGDDALSVRVRQGIDEHIKKELSLWPNRDLNWKYEKGRRVAAKYMYDKMGGGQ
jgi:hypothetical protein